MAKRGQTALTIGRVWGGIDRTVSTFDKRTEAAEVACDVELFPEGRLVSRAGYLALYNSLYVYKSIPEVKGSPEAEAAYPTSLPTSAAGVDVPNGDITPYGIIGGTNPMGGGDTLLTIKAIHEWEQPNADGTTTQRHVIQLSDNLFYRYHFGDHPGWVALENTYKDDNATLWFYKRLTPTLVNGGMDVTVRPVPNPHAHFWDHKGVLRMGLGTGAKAIPLWYGRIDRKFFTNDAANEFANWMLDVTPLQPPTANASNRLAAGVVDDTLINASYGVAKSDGAFGIATSYYPAENAIEAAKNYTAWFRSTGQDENDNPIIEWGDGVKPDDTFFPNQGGNQNYIYFYIGLSYIYDGYQESQIYLIDDTKMDQRTFPLSNYPQNHITDAFMIGNILGAGGVNSLSHVYPTINLRLNGTDNYNISAGGAEPLPANYPYRTNPRVTSIRIWFGRLETYTDKPEQVNFYPVKEVIVSQKDEFKTEIWNGNHQWVKGVDDTKPFSDPNYYYLSVPIGLNDWLEALRQGDYSRINGHNIPQIDDTFGLQRSPFLEGYRYAEVVKDQVIYGGIRWFGEVREAHVIKGAVFSSGGGGEVQEDVMDCSPLDLEHQVQGLRKLDDDTLGIVTTSTVEKRTMPDLVKRHTASGGCSAPDSVIQADNAILFYKDGQMYLYNGVNDPRVVSDKYGRDSDDGVYIGLLNTNSHSNVWSFYLPVLRKQIIFCKDTSTTWHCFVYDLKTRKYVEFKFWHTCHLVGAPPVARQFVAGCRGVDGEMDFTDGYYIYRFPIGLHDNLQVIDPVYQTADLQLPPELEAALNDLDVNHKTLIGTLNVTIRRDKEVTKNVTKTFAPDDAVSNIKATKPIAYGTRITKCVSLKFSLTDATTASVLDVESAQLTMIPQESV